MINENIIPEYCSKEILVLGCGNVLFGDDGFGPAVIEYILTEDNTVDHACFLNVGTSSRKILFNVVLSEEKPKRIIIVDAMDYGGKPGAVTELDLNAIPYNKIDDFSMHQVPTSNLLREVRDICGVEVVLIVCQPAEIPEEVCPGLSMLVQQAVKQATEIVLQNCMLEQTED